MSKKITIEIEGLEKTQFKLKNLNLIKTQKVKEVVRDSAYTVERNAKRDCPVDTGRLRASISTTFHKDGFTAEVGTNVEYAPYIEFGTSKMKSQPFLHPAYKQEIIKFLAKLKIIFKKP